MLCDGTLMNALRST